VIVVIVIVVGPDPCLVPPWEGPKRGGMSMVGGSSWTTTDNNYLENVALLRLVLFGSTA
jgi:hypothetical protein